MLPYTNREWEKLSILLNLLITKLPAPKEEDLSKGILEAIDMDSYRVEKKAVLKIALADSDAEIAPVPVEGGGHKREPELDRLSNILKVFNDQFGTLFTDSDRIIRRINEDIAPKVAADQPYQNARRNTPNTARIELDAALMRVISPLLKDDTEFYKQFVQNGRSSASSPTWSPRLPALRPRSIGPSARRGDQKHLQSLRSIVSVKGATLLRWQES